MKIEILKSAKGNEQKKLNRQFRVPVDRQNRHLKLNGKETVAEKSRLNWNRLLNFKYLNLKCFSYLKKEMRQLYQRVGNKPSSQETRARELFEKNTE